MKRIKSRKVNAAIIAGALSASIVLGGVATALSCLVEDKTTRFVNALESNYNIQINNSEGKTYYVAPDVAEGEGDGTSANPYNIRWILTNTASPLAAGDTVLVKPGAYRMFNRVRILDKGGEYNKYITVKCEDPAKETVLDFSDNEFNSLNRGVEINTDFWYWYGVDIRGAGDNGMYIGGSYNVVENCEFYNNRDTGLQLGRGDGSYNSIYQWPSYNLIKNCTSHNNYDNETYGENADGFAAKLTVGYGNIFDGCVAYRNSDDGWDLFAKVDSGNIGAVIIYNCVAFENGYLEETQEEFNARFKRFDVEKKEIDTNSYLTKDGDGNGFKLGGSVMEGDVYMYNCLSFNNRMHGVTDNSNPGVLSIKNVTAFNNSAGIDNNPASPTFGQIILNGTGISGDGKSGNINMARQTYSYNLFSNVLSVNKDLATVAADEYRGSAEYSYFDLVSGKANKVVECVDVSSRTEDYATKGESVNAISAEIFAKLPIEWTSKTNPTYTYNLSGLRYTTFDDTYRNADGSLNMGDILKITDYSKLFGDSHKIGADLSKTSWEEYEHYSYFNASNATSAADAAVKSAVATLDLNTNINATFQDFDLIVAMEDVKIEWTSADTSKIAINTDTETSFSGTKDARAVVTRGTKDETVMLTATVTSTKDSTVSMTKEFLINIKKDVPTIGKGIYEGVEENLVIYDQFDKVELPEFKVTNAAYYNGRLLDASAYQVDTTVMYTSDKEITPVEIHHFTPNVAGIFHITNSVKLGTQSKDFTYTVYVASPTANVNFSDTPSVSVYRDGYTISGAVNSATGKLYAYSSKTAIEGITAEQVIANGKGYEFRADDISFNFENDNASAYYIYYVMCNLHGDVTSQVGSVEVKTKEINDIAGFKDMMLNSNTSTIYLLKADLDLSGESNWISEVTGKKKGFSGLLNGLGHTVKNFTVSATANDEEAALFYRLAGGTVENIKFENFNITSTKKKVGIFATTYGGYIYNVAMKNVRVYGDERVGALVGQVMNGELFVDQISFVAEATYSKQDISETDFAKNIYYVLDGGKYKVASEYEAGKEYYLRDYDLTGERCGVVAGDIQASSANNSTQTHISNVYVDCVIGVKQYHGSIVGRFDDRNAKDYLSISQCYSVATVYGQTYVGGIIGSGNNTGAGVLRVNGCAFNGELYYGGDNVTALISSLKNCSGIVGRYSSVADSLVTKCYAKFEDNNSNHYVESETFTTGPVYVTIFTQQMGFSGDRWEFTMKQGNEYEMVAPYVVIKFLGNWN